MDLSFAVRPWWRFARIAVFKCLAILLLFLVLGSAPLAAQEPTSESNQDHVALLLRLNKVAKPIEAYDTAGTKRSMVNLAGHKALVIFFLDFRCPISNRMVPVLNDLAARYTGRDVLFGGVVCDGVTLDELNRKKKEYQIGFDLFHDPQHALANYFHATTTPQAFVLDNKLVLRYFGAINDQNPNRTTRLNAPARHYLADALDQILANHIVVPSNTEAVGCPISRVRKPVSESGTITFHKDVEPLLQKHCQRCHHSDGVAPFSLLTFEEAFNWADDIREFVSSRRMPPWPITGGLPLKKDISLKPDEIATICKWAEEGCPRGNPQDAPKPVVFKSEEEWDDANPPDLILNMPGTFHLAAKGEDHYRSIVFPLGNKEEKYVRKIHFIPGNKKLIHHSLVFYDGTGLMLDAQKRLGKAKPFGLGDEDYGPGYESGMGLGFIPNPAALTRNPDNPGASLGGWTPGAGVEDNPSGARQVVPPDSAIILQIHYHRTGKPEVDDSTRLAIWFDKEKPKKYVACHLVDASFRLVPKNVDRFKSTGSRLITVDSELYLIFPHMHMLGKEFRVWHQPKDSRERRLLLELRNWDFNWQTRYLLKENFFMEKGSTIHMEAIWDNSRDNPNNPYSPPRTIFLGESTSDEMGIMTFGVLRDNPPNVGGDFLNYLKKLLEAEALKKLLSGTIAP